MSIFRGTGGSGNSTDDSIVSAVTEQAGIATTKAGEAATSASNANTSATNAATSATTASTKATEAASSATTASTKATEANTAKTGAEAAKTAAEAARDTALVHANTANNTHVQTVSGIATEVQNLDSIKTDITGVNTIKSDVTTVAGISSNVTTVAADASDIGTVATNITNVNNVGDNISNVNSVAGNATNINTVAGDASDIGTVSSNISNVNTVAGISSDVTTVAGLESKMDTVIADASDIGAVANNIDDVTTVAGINSEVDTVAGISAKVTTVADNIADVQNADTNAANASASASQAANSATAASASATTASTKATESLASALAASNSASTASTKATEAAGSATTATTKATEASTSATNAATSATTATTKASEAASSATAASGSATTATTKASEADASANSAASSATDASNAASTWTNYYSTYLGAADAPPTADVQGNALQTGAFYYDTGAGSNTVGLYVYNGSSWVYSTNYNNVTAPYSLAQDLATNGNDISFGDNAKAKFGASDDLQIYHDGTNSYVKDTGTGYLILGNSDAGTIIKNGSGQNLLTTTASEIRLGHEGNTKLATKSTGIDVTGTVTADGLIVDGTDSLRSSADDSLINISGGNATNSGANYALFGETHASLAGVHRWRTDGNERMRIDSSGNVGIGTTSPNSNLELSSATGSATISPTELRITSSTQASDWSTTDSWGVLAFHSSDTSGGGAGNLAEISANMENSVGGFASIDFTLQNPASSYAHTSWLKLRNSASVENRFVEIKADGGLYVENKVGIGTTSPAANLHVDASAPEFRLSQSGTAKVRLRTTGDNYINTGQNLGIGTTSPNGKLEVSSADFDTLYLTRSTAGSATILMKNSSNNGGLVQSLGNGGLSFFSTVSDSSSERMRIDSSGKVGIGTSSPSSILDLGSNTNTSQEITISGGRARFGYDTAKGTSGAVVIQGSANKAIHFENTADTSAMVIDASGNVGIGTTSPATNLHVDSGSYTAATFERNAGANSGVSVDLINSDGNKFNLASEGTENFNIGYTPSGGSKTNLLTLNSSGNVGIGGNPAAVTHGPHLDLVGNRGTLTVGTGYFEDNGNTNFIGGARSLAFGSAGSSTERMRIDASGNVLVGKTATAFGTAGSVSYATGLLTATVDGNACVQLNRLTSDGVIQTFGKDGTTVGSIGTTGGDMYVGTGDTGIRFDDETNHIRPCGVNGANLDATIDIGDSTRRFKDLYLSGTLHGDKYDIYSEGGGSLYQTDGYVRFANGNTETARIDSSGNLLVGTTSQISSGKLSVAGGASANGITATTAATSGYTVASFQRTASDGQAVQFKRGAAEVGSISLTSSATAYNTSSDQRLKENIQDSADAGSKIDAIQIRQFDWKSDGSHQDYGVIAQELLEVAPEAVTEGETEDDMMSVDYSKLVPTLIKEIQTLRNRVAQLEKN